MPTTTVKWIDGLNFIGVDSTQHSVVMSGEKKGAGVKPSELLLIALAACSAVDVVEILSKKRIILSQLEIHATGEHAPEPPWAFLKIHIKYCLKGQGLTDKAVQQAIELSEKKYCSVAATVRGVADISIEYEINPV